MQNIDKINSLIHPWIQHLKKLVTNSKYRKSHNSTVITNRNILNELFDSGSIIYLACTNELVEDSGLKPNFMLTDSRLINYVCGSASNDGILAEVKTPAMKILPNASQIERSIFIPRIRDPCNMGMLARTAKALYSNMFAIGQPGSADPFNYKAVSTSRGIVLDPNFIANFNAEKPLLQLRQLALIAEIEKKIPRTYVKVFEKGFLNFYGRLGTNFFLDSPRALSNANIVLGCESNGFDGIIDYKKSLPVNFHFVSIKSKDNSPMNVATSLAVIASTCWSST
jgi:hypothetical protein